MDVFKTWNISFYTCQPGDHNHMGIVERFNRTLREKFTKLWVTSGNNNFEWIDHLEDIVYNYNHTKHSTLGATPFQVMNAEEYNNQIIKDVEQPVFNIGDRVRVKLELSKFDKGSLPKWSINTFKILQKIGNKYLTSKDDKPKATHELQKIDADNIIKPNETKVQADLLSRSRKLSRKRRI